MDPHDAHAAAVRHNNALVRGTYEEGYSAGKAEGIKEGMRRAAEIVRQNAKEVALSVRPYEPISVENVRLLMKDANDACAAIALAILKEIRK